MVIFEMGARHGRTKRSAWGVTKTLDPIQLCLGLSLLEYQGDVSDGGGKGRDSAVGHTKWEKGAMNSLSLSHAPSTRKEEEETGGGDENETEKGGK